VKFIDEAECEEITRLRIEHLTKRREDRVKLCNLLGWCLLSKQYDDDEEMLVQHFTLLHQLHRADEFFQRVILPLFYFIYSSVSWKNSLDKNKKFNCTC